MSAPETVITMLPPFADVAVIVFVTMVLTAWTALIVDVGLTPRKSFETTLNGAAKVAELILTLPATVTGKVSLAATGDAASVPPTKVVFVSTVSVNVTPVASSAVAPIETVYFSVSPGSAFVSPSTSVNNESTFVAVTVGANRLSAELFTADRFEVVETEFDVELFGTPSLFWTVLDIFWRMRPELRDSTETENAIAASMQTPAIKRGTTDRVFDDLDFF